jgi:hypothetical protein
MIAVVSFFVALVCLAASARRVHLVTTATSFDVELLVRELRGDAGARRGPAVTQALAESDAPWEGQVARAVRAKDPRVRVAELNEAFTELDFALSRWSRVPRVCASLSSSVGFLLAALLLRQGLSDPTALSGDVLELVTSGLVGQALTVVGFGLAGAIGCAALKAQADRAARAAASFADELVDRIEELGARAVAAGESGASPDAP